MRYDGDIAITRDITGYHGYSLSRTIKPGEKVYFEAEILEVTGSSEMLGVTPVTKVLKGKTFGSTAGANMSEMLLWYTTGTIYSDNKTVSGTIRNSFHAGDRVKIFVDTEDWVFGYGKIGDEFSLVEIPEKMRQELKIIKIGYRHTKIKYIGKRMDFAADVPNGYKPLLMGDIPMIISLDGVLYTVEDGVPRRIDGEVNGELIRSNGVMDLNVFLEAFELNDYNTVKFYGESHRDEEYSIMTKIIPDKALLLANGDLSLKAVENIDFFQVDFTKIGDAEIKLIVSVDEGETWQTYESGMWEPINPTVEEVDLYGIDTSVFNLIRPERWNELRKYSDTIRFGYLLKHNEELDFAKVHALNAQFDMTGVWKASVHGKDFEYEYPDNSTIRVKILRNGDYKINY